MARSTHKRRHERSRSRSSSRSSSSSSKSRSSASSSSSRSVSSSSSKSSSSSSSSSSHSSSSSSGRSSRSEISRNNKRRSPSPVTRIQILRLTKNVNKNHIMEIFKTYGPIKRVELPQDKWHPHLNRGSAYIEFDEPSAAEKAIKFMDGGQIDGQKINVSRSYNRNSF